VLSELMRVFVSEAGWKARADHLAMAAILQRYARRTGSTLVDAIATRVWAHSNALQARPWLTRLDQDCEAPYGFPGRWENYEPRCRRVAETAAMALATGPWRCPRAKGWRSYGAPLQKALGLGYEQVSCAGNVVAYVRPT
jgi:hypothetical protein